MTEEASRRPPQRKVSGIGRTVPAWLLIVLLVLAVGAALALYAALS